MKYGKKKLRKYVIEKTHPTDTVGTVAASTDGILQCMKTWVLLSGAVHVFFVKPSFNQRTDGQDNSKSKTY